MDKLDGLPSVHCITLKESVDRRQNLLKWFDEYGVPSYTINVFDRNIDLSQYAFVGKYSDRIPETERKIFISHFSTLRRWYESTNEPCLIVFEDDVSFETVQYWNFSWKQFHESIPESCKCIQLSLIRYKCEPYEFAPREPLRRGHWSACAYFMKREYVKHLLEIYNPVSNSFLLEIQDTDMYPDLESILFLDIKKRVYVFPLFLEDCYVLGSTFSKSENPHRYMSHDCVLNWWKEFGKDLNLKDMMDLTNIIHREISHEIRCGYR